MADESKKSIFISKLIVFAFFSIYFIIFGVILSQFINSAQISNPGSIPIYITYIPLLCYVGSIFTLLGLLIVIRNARTEKPKGPKKDTKLKASAMYKQALFLIIFVFSFVPLFASIIDSGVNDQNFSIYNYDYYQGGYRFKHLIENQGYTDIRAVQSSLSATQRLGIESNKSILLILFGPNQFYDPVFEIPYFINFFEGGNSLLILHDHGSTSTLLWEILIASMFDPTINIPVTVFPDGILRDNQSFERNPEFPVISNFSPHPTTSGINKVVLSRATAAVGGPLISFFGWNPIGFSTIYGFVDKNGDKMYKYEDDSVDLTFMNASLPMIPDYLLKVPLGGFPQTVFMAKDLGGSRIFVSSDASMFNNELIMNTNFDNARFATNIINWLTYGENDWIIVFDEAHIRPEFMRDLTSAGIYGFIMQYIIHLSTNPITAWIYPILAVYSLKKYVPKKDKKKEQKKKAEEQEKKEQRMKFRTSSFFAEKIQWYKDKRKFEKGLTLLFRRLERKLNSQLSGSPITTDNVANLVIAKDPNAKKFKIRRITRFLEKMLAIKNGKLKIRNENEFQEFFYEMEWVSVNI